MCVIIVKKAGVNVPSKSLLKKAASVNHDGCGFATSSGHYYRSTNFEEFYKEFSKVAKVEEDIVLHFRWATHGSVNASNCHPFKAYVCGKPMFFAHNGVLPIESADDKTDSELCYREAILPILRSAGGKFTKRVCAYLNSLTEDYSKFAFVNEEGVHLIGEYTNYNGLLLSNTRFLGWQYMYSASGIKATGGTKGGSKYAGVGI